MNYHGTLLRQGLRCSFAVRIVRLIPLLNLSLYSTHDNPFYNPRDVHA